MNYRQSVKSGKWCDGSSSEVEESSWVLGVMPLFLLNTYWQVCTDVLLIMHLRRQLPIPISKWKLSTLRRTLWKEWLAWGLELCVRGLASQSLIHILLCLSLLDRLVSVIVWLHTLTSEESVLDDRGRFSHGNYTSSQCHLTFTRSLLGSSL